MIGGVKSVRCNLRINNFKRILPITSKLEIVGKIK